MLNEEMMNKEQKLDSIERKIELSATAIIANKYTLIDNMKRYVAQTKTATATKQTIEKLLKEQKEKMDSMINGNTIVSRQGEFLMKKNELLSNLKMEILKNKDELEAMADRLDFNNNDFSHLDEYTRQSLNEGLVKSIAEKERTIQSLQNTRDDHEKLLTEVQDGIGEHIKNLKSSKNDMNELNSLIENLQKSYETSISEADEKFEELRDTYESINDELQNLNEMKSDVRELLDTKKSRKFSGLVGKLVLISKISWKIVTGSIQETDSGTYIDYSIKKSKGQELLDNIETKQAQMMEKLEAVSDRIEEVEAVRDNEIDEGKEYKEMIKTEAVNAEQKEDISQKTDEILRKLDEMGLSRNISNQYVNTLVKHEHINPHVQKEQVEKVHVVDRDEDEELFNIQESNLNQNLNHIGLGVSKAAALDQKYSTNYTDMLNEARSFENMQKINNVLEPIADNMQVVQNYMNTDIDATVMDEYNKFNAEVAADMNNELYWLGNTQKIDKFTDITQKTMSQADKQIKQKKAIGNLTKNYQAMRNPQTQQQTNQTPSAPQGKGKTKKAVKQNQQTQTTTKTQGLG